MLDKDYPYINFKSEESQSLSEDRCTRCPICEKVFYIAVVDDYVYKLCNTRGRQRLMCSWSCYRKAQKIREGSLKYHMVHI